MSTHANKTIFLASDHGGFALKETVKNWLIVGGWQVEDCGANEFNEQDDFPDFISLAAKAVSEDSDSKVAIIFGGSGQGEAIMANRFQGVRAVVYYGGDKEIVKLSRTHNDANVLSLGARFISEAEARTVIEDWLKEEFTGETKRIRRNTKLDSLS